MAIIEDMHTPRDFIENFNSNTRDKPIGPGWADIAYDEPMSAHTSLRIGGPADVFVRPHSPEAARKLLELARAEGIATTILGAGANILVGDRGIRGIVVDTLRLSSVRTEGDLLVVGAGLSIDELCLEACCRGLSGLQDFAGMPGSVGGAVYMNARCYEREMADVLAWVACSPITLYRPVDTLDPLYRPVNTQNPLYRPVDTPDDLYLPVGPSDPLYRPVDTLDPLYLPVGFSSAPAETNEEPTESKPLRLPLETQDWSYKRSPFQPGGSAEGALILEAAFRLEPSDAATIAATMRARRADRESKGHYRLPSAGSVFKNDRRFGRPTGMILDSLGFRSRKIGGAMVAPWHANIFVNAGGATAADFLALIELARTEARERLGIELEPEVLAIGEF